MLPPLGAEKPRVLILGSLPGRRSLAEQRYYAHPQNAFWWIMRSLLNNPLASVEQQKSALTRQGILLWDVLHTAERPGSLDADIRAGTERFNPIASLLADKSQLKLIVCNGKKAMSLFDRLPDYAQLQSIDRVCLPSTSAAHARLRPEQKLQQWKEAIAPYLS